MRSSRIAWLARAWVAASSGSSSGGAAERAASSRSSSPVSDWLTSSWRSRATRARSSSWAASAADPARRLRPTALDDLGLAAAIAGLVERLGEGEIKATIAIDGDFSDLSDDAQLVVYRVAQEGLLNAARHSGAARVAVALRRGPEGVELTVADDGRGFAFAESERGLGIGGMRERALLVGGDLTIESRPGAGTTVRLTIPAESFS